MNLKQLRRFARWAKKIAAADKQLADELAEALRKAEAAGDPLGLYIYQARARFRRTSDADKSKGGKSIERDLQMTYVDATNLGFQGSFGLWGQLMRMGKSAEEVAREEKKEPVSYGRCL
jgi:hypothetical protein